MNNTITLKKQGSPTIFLWGDYREKDINAYTKDVKIQEDYAKLIDSVYKVVNEILQTKNIKEKDIECIRTSFYHKSKLVHEEAGKRIVQLSHYSSIFESMFNELSFDRQSNIRLRVVQSHWKDFPSEKQANEILTRTLNDVSKKVRIFTIDRIIYFKQKHLLSSLKERYFVEVDLKIKEQIENGVNLFEKSYYMREVGKEKVSITFAHNEGMKSFLLNKSNLTEELIIEEIAKRK